MAFAIKAVLGMRGFFSFIPQSGPNKDKLVTRPAQVVQVWGPEMVNVVVFVDGTNDGEAIGTMAVWQTSVYVKEFAENRAFSYKAEAAPAPAVATANTIPAGYTGAAVPTNSPSAAPATTVTADSQPATTEVAS